MKGNSAESTAAMNKAGLGFWLGELSDRWTARSHSTSADTTTLSLVSAHDTTLIPILIALGVMESGEWPDYASSIIFELYSRGVDGKQGLDSQVRVIYNDEVITHKIPGAGGSEYVPVRKLQELIDSFRPRDLERDCMTSQEKGRGAASEGGKDTF